MIHLILVLTIVVGANTTHARIYEGPFGDTDKCAERAYELLKYTKVRMGVLTKFTSRVSGAFKCEAPGRIV